jgi:signal transduction histidine kinase
LLRCAERCTFASDATASGIAIHVPASPAATSPLSAEHRRVTALRDYGILDTPTEGVFDDFTRIAAAICDTPIAVVNLIDSTRQWFKSEIGLGVRETPLDVSICAHAILQNDLFVVPDTTLDARFARNPLVAGDPGLRFYAGALLKTPDGLAVGTMCVLDTQPRELDATQLGVLQSLARQVMAQLELRKALREQERISHYRAQLLATIGHDLKSPLRNALYALSRTGDEALSDDMRRRLDTATLALQQIDRDFNKLIAGAGGRGTFHAADSEWVALDGFLATVMAPWRTLADRKRLDLRIASTRVSVRTHATLLATLVGNLVGNAVKYSERGGVLLGVRRLEGAIAIDVVDTGIGIPPEALEHLFDAFRQADTTSDGLGLGLWIVRQAAETLGATLAVSSRPGRGTRVRVLLPQLPASGGITLQT